MKRLRHVNAAMVAAAMAAVAPGASPAAEVNTSTAPAEPVAPAGDQQTAVLDERRDRELLVPVRALNVLRTPKAGEVVQGAWANTGVLWKAFAARRSCERRHKVNRLHLARKAKHRRRRSA